MELTGRIIAVQETKSGTSSKTGNQWMKQEYVIEIPGQYTRHCVFTVFGEDRIKQLNIQNGEDLTVQFDVDAHEYNGRWYNDFKAYNVIRGQEIPQPQTVEKTPTINVEDPFGTKDGSDLPF